MNPAEIVAQSLTNDKPTIDSALKGFISLVVARVYSVSDPNIKAISGGGGRDKSVVKTTQSHGEYEKCFFIKTKSPNQAALACARAFLGVINNFRIPEYQNQTAVSLEKDVVRILWNGFINSGDTNKRPSKILGRLSLTHVISEIEMDLLSIPVPGVDERESKSFMSEFVYLLSRANQRKDPNLLFEEKSKLEKDEDDSCLLWDEDGGCAELKRRKCKRESKAK